MQILKRNICYFSIFYFLLAFFVFVQAQSTYTPYALEGISDSSAFRFQVGYNPKFTRAELAYETKPLWARSIFSHPLELTVEAGVAYWRANHVKNEPYYRNDLWQVSAIPMFKWWMSNRWYLEGGIGPTLLSRTRFVDKEFSTSFQFGDHIGIGRSISNNLRLSIRASHFSNGSIKKPNNGLNVGSLSVMLLF